MEFCNYNSFRELTYVICECVSNIVSEAHKSLQIVLQCVHVCKRLILSSHISRTSILYGIVTTVTGRLLFFVGI